MMSSATLAPGLSVTSARGVSPPSIVRPRDNGGLEDRRMAVEHAFDLDRRDVLPTEMIVSFGRSLIA
jgi:hypothetical protein